MQETWVRSLGWEDHLENEMATCPVFLPGKSYGEPGGLYIVHGVTKSVTGFSPKQQ